MSAYGWFARLMGIAPESFSANEQAAPLNFIRCKEQLFFF
jgi:hypothetical protein